MNNDDTWNTWTAGSNRLMHDQTAQHYQSDGPISKKAKINKLQVFVFASFDTGLPLWSCWVTDGIWELVEVRNRTHYIIQHVSPRIWHSNDCSMCRLFTFFPTKHITFCLYWFEFSPSFFLQVDNFYDIISSVTCSAKKNNH